MLTKPPVISPAPVEDSAPARESEPAMTSAILIPSASMASFFFRIPKSTISRPPRQVITQVASPSLSPNSLSKGQQHSSLYPAVCKNSQRNILSFPISNRNLKIKSVPMLKSPKTSPAFGLPKAKSTLCKLNFSLPNKKSSGLCFQRSEPVRAEEET